MNVLLVGTIEPSLANTVEAKYQALQLPNGAKGTAFLAQHGASITAIVDGGTPGVDADLMNALPNLGAIVHQGAGYDTIDVDAARRLGIGVSNTPDVLDDTVADTAVGLMLATMRGLCTADRFVRDDLWRLNGRYPLGRDLSGSRVGILGLGRIGSAIASGSSALTAPSFITVAMKWPALRSVTSPHRSSWLRQLTCWWLRPSAARAPSTL
jgi:lactate dehydrogenase-like 2-hydroxyacid dehydrogenase